MLAYISFTVSFLCRNVQGEAQPSREEVEASGGGGGGEASSAPPPPPPPPKMKALRTVQIHSSSPAVRQDLIISISSSKTADMGWYRFSILTPALIVTKSYEYGPQLMACGITWVIFPPLSVIMCEKHPSICSGLKSKKLNPLQLHTLHGYFNPCVHAG